METTDFMKKTVASHKVSNMIHQLAIAVAEGQRKVGLSLSNDGNSFTIDMEGASISITINEKGDAE